MVRVFAGCLLVMIAAVTVWAAPQLVVDEPIWDAGTVTSGVRYEKTVTVRNAGDEPLVIDRIENCCGFYGRLESLPLTLQPMEEVALHLILKPFNMVGDLDGDIALYSNDPEWPEFPMAVFGHVVPKKYVSSELQTVSLDLGVVDPGDRVPFTIMVDSTGNQPLQVSGVEKSAAVAVLSMGEGVPPGATGQLRLEYLPRQVGPIDERILISTNDTLNRTLEFRLQGYVSRERLPQRALILHPVGQTVEFDPGNRDYEYRFVLENRGTREVQLVGVKSSLPVRNLLAVERVPPGEEAEGRVTFELQQEELPLKGHIYLNIAVPVEVR